MKERYLPQVRLFADGVLTNLGILHEVGHEEPWIIAMECTPTPAAVLDYGARWAIEPTFSDFKSAASICRPRNWNMQIALNA